MSGTLVFRVWHCLAEFFTARFLRFLAVGVLNAAFGYGCYRLLLYLGLSYPLALFCATVVGVLFNFQTTGRFVFGSGDNRLIWRFIMVYAILYGINVGMIHMLILWHISASIAGALALPPMALLTFLFNRSFVFKNV
jgi:putative flippase GtrA